MTNAVNPALDGEPASPPTQGELVFNSQNEESLLVSRLAALDDCLSGRMSAEGLAAAPYYDAMDSNLAETLDAILLLRQVAAADREGVRSPIVMPATVGRFEVVREVGRGGFAFVVEAFDPKLCRRVALKVARPEAALSEEVRRRFIREAELAARLVHPHIVAIHEVGESDGLAFIAQEFCAGGSLADWLATHPGPLDPPTATRLVRALAEAVAHAHAAGILHRDIKPGNVLLVPAAAEHAAILPAGDGVAGWTVKLGDFGLGKPFNESSDEALTQLTRSGARIGTPAWMAPEQIDRSFGEVGPATDIHALGMLLERLLTGRCLHEGSTEAETFRMILLRDPIPPDKVNRRVSADLAAVCMKCLAKRPADRYPTSAELAADLSRHFEGRPTLARPLSAAARLSRAIARRPVVFGLLAAAAASLLLAGWATRERGREIEKRSESASLVRQHDAAAELRRGFEAWRIGNVGAAKAHLRSCGSIDGELSRSVAARWLLRRLHGERAILLEPADPGKDRIDLYSCAVSPDGRTLAAGGADGTLSLVAPAGDGWPGRPTLAIAAHDEVNDVAFSPDGTVVATAGQDGRLRMWSVAGGDPVREMPPAAGPLFAVAFSSDSACLAYGGADRVLRLATPGDPASTREVRPFEDVADVAKDAEIESIQFLGSDAVAVACGRRIAIVGRLDGKSRRMLTGHDGVVAHLALSRDGTRLLTAGTDRHPRVWDVASGTKLRQLPAHPSWVQGCDFSPDGRSIATGCRDGVIRVFDAETGVLRTRLVGHGGRTWDLRFAPDGSIVSAGADGTLRRWDAKSQPDLAGVTELRLPDTAGDGDARDPGAAIVRATAFRSGPPAPTVVEFDDGQQAVVCDTSPRGDSPPRTENASMYKLAIDWPRRRFAIPCFSQLVEVHRLPEATAATSLLSTDRNPSAGAAWSLPADQSPSERGVAWTPSGALLMGRSRGTLLAWDAALGWSHDVDQFTDPVYAIAVLDAGRPRVAVAASRIVKVYGLASSGVPVSSKGKTLVALDPAADPIVEIAWSPDGRRLAYGTNHGVLQVIDSDSGATIFGLAAHGREITGIIWSEDGRTLITADTECVRFSDAMTTTTYDELRPGWRIERLSLSFGGPQDAQRIVVIAGHAVATGDAGDGGMRAAVLDVRSPPPGLEPHP